MSDAPGLQPETPSAGAAIFLIDESRSMAARVAEGTKSKIESIATALNSLLNQLTAVGDLDVAIVGYRREADGSENVGCRWAGPLAGRTFVPTSQLAASPAAVEDRVRKIPGPGGLGVAREETIRFPIWYVPALGEAASPAAAYAYCRQLLADRMVMSKPPLLVSFLGDPSEPGVLPAAAAGLPLVLHAHLSTAARVPPTLYPSAESHLPPGPVRDCFQSSSVLPEPMLAALRAAQVSVNPGARGLIYHAKMADLIRMLAMVRAYGQDRTTAVIPAKPQAAMVVLVLDRSIEEPSHRAWTRLQEHANDLLGQIAKRKIEAALIAYGPDGVQNVPIATPLRTEEFTEQVSNGIGGLVSLTRKRPIYVDLPPTGPAAPGPAFAAAATMLAGRAPAIVLHLTRGRVDCTAIQQAAAMLPAGTTLYHLVVTESPHRSLAYPGQASGIDDAALAMLWELTSPLLSRERLAAEKPAVSLESRGIVINGKFDLLLDGITV